MARAIDALTVVTVLWIGIVLHLFWFVGDLVERHHPEPWGRRLVPAIGFVVLAALYEWVFVVHSSGQTPGKDIMKVRVVGNTRAAVSTPRAVIRWLPLGLVALAPGWLVAVLVVAGVGAPIIRSDRRTLADLIAGTHVVPYDRDLEDPTARRPKSRWRRRLEAADEGLDGLHHTSSGVAR